jgi:thiol-disulfide isomerase/thioredoxin
VLVAVAALVVVRLTGLGSSQAQTATGAADGGVIAGVTSVPAGVLDQVGAGTMKTPPKTISGAALTADGKPKVLYVGAEYCPYCAAERWAMVVALSRFGTFSGLGQTASSADDVYPSTATLTFHGSTYTSKTIAFTGVEAESNKRSGSGYETLDTPTAEDEQTFTSLSGGSYPFVDIGGRYMISGASYDVQLLQGKSHQEIASALSDPDSDIAKAVDGTANAITAAICATTGNQPTAVCSATGVQAAAKTLS